MSWRQSRADAQARAALSDVRAIIEDLEREVERLRALIGHIEDLEREVERLHDLIGPVSDLWQAPGPRVELTQPLEVYALAPGPSEYPTIFCLYPEDARALAQLRQARLLPRSPAWRQPNPLPHEPSTPKPTTSSTATDETTTET